MSTFSYKVIDELLSGRLRLAIIAFLMTADESNFKELLTHTEATKGNLGAQLRKLEDAGYVDLDKGYRGRLTHMRVLITAKGRGAFLRYVEHLQSIATDKHTNQ